MHATTVAIDLAKDVFELAFADPAGRILERKRLTRRAFSRVMENRPAVTVVMEACGSAHHWGRRFEALGHSVCLLPARDVRPYVRRNKTDRADAAGLVEAARCAQIAEVPVKTPRQQGLQALHRVREQLKAQRTATINLVRGLLREYGVVIPNGAAKVAAAVRSALEDADNDVPMALLIHGGRAVLRAALMRRRAGHALDPLHAWALDLAQRQGHNEAAVALANKLARRLWALDHHGAAFDPHHISHKPA